jgi:hypothetical protein
MLKSLIIKGTWQQHKKTMLEPRKKMKSQMINLNAADTERPIYRIDSCQRFMSILSARENALRRPKMWEDPFENFILSATLLLRDGTKARVGYRDHLYGQCWSLHKETDLMWRAYSPNRDAVKLKTTIGSLLSSLYSQSGRYRDISCFIGKVRYLPKKDIPKVFSEANIFDSSGRDIAATLLVKRWAFRGEKEVRLIYFHNGTPNIGDVYTYPIDPNALFDEAVLDPRMNEDEGANWRSQIQSAGFRNRIFQSDLYKPPQQMFITM